MKQNSTTRRKDKRQKTARIPGRILVAILSVALVVALVVPMVLAQEEAPAAGQSAESTQPPSPDDPGFIPPEPSDSSAVPPAETAVSELPELPSGQPSEDIPPETAFYSVQFLDYAGSPVGGTQSVPDGGAALAPAPAAIPAPKGQVFSAWNSDSYLEVHTNLTVHAIYEPSQAEPAQTQPVHTESSAPSESPLLKAQATASWTVGVYNATYSGMAHSIQITGGSGEPAPAYPTVSRARAAGGTWTDWADAPVSFTDAGTYEYEVKWADGYVDASMNPALSYTCTIAKAPLTAQLGSYQAPRYSTVAYEVSYSGFVNGENESVLLTPTVISCSYDPFRSPAGAYTISGSGATAKNYDIQYKIGTLTITSGDYRLGITAPGKFYDGLESAVHVSLNPSALDVEWRSRPEGGGNWSPWSTTNIQYIDVGRYEYEARFVNPYYNVNGTTLTLTLVISPRRLQVRGGDATIFVGDPPPAYTYRYPTAFELAGAPYQYLNGGFAQFENEGTELATAPAATCAYRQGDPAGDYDVNVSGAVLKPGKSSLNYVLEYVPGKLHVVPRSTIVVTAGSAEKTYDGTPLTKNSYTQTGLPDGFRLEVTVTGSATNVWDTADGNNRVTGVEVYNTSSGQKVTPQFPIQTVNGTLSIFRRDVRLKAVDRIVEYDGKVHGLDEWEEVGSFSPHGYGLLPGHVITGVKESVKGFDREAPGFGINVGVYGVYPELPGADGFLYPDSSEMKILDTNNGNADMRDNYEIGKAGGVLTIVPRKATVTALDASKTVGQADPPIQVSMTGNLPSEPLQYSLSRDPGEEAGRYTIHVNPGANPNYDVTYINGTLTIVTPGQPTPTPTATPTNTPTATPTSAPTDAPTSVPTDAPTGTPRPSAPPTAAPTGAPTQPPTTAPTASPAQPPTATPGSSAVAGVAASIPPGPSAGVKLDIGASDVPTVSLGNMQVPLYGFTGVWALVNLLLVIVTGIIMAALLITWFVGRKRREYEDSAYSRRESQEGQVKRKGLLRLFSILVLAVSLIAFLLTEDMRLPMVMVDQWTPLMAVIAVIQAVLALFSAKKRTSPDELENSEPV